MKDNNLEMIKAGLDKATQKGAFTMNEVISLSNGLANISRVIDMLQKDNESLRERLGSEDNSLTKTPALDPGVSVKPKTS
jgi:hypothetical protein